MSSLLRRLRIVAINDVYELTHLPKLATLIRRVKPDCVLLAGDFLSPSTLSSVDGGRGMVATLRAAGLTSCCLGNHEADLPLRDLQDRLATLQKSVAVINTNMRQDLPESAAWLETMLPAYSIVTTSTTTTRPVNVALLGLMSDESNMFRNHSFRQAPIQNVCEAYDDMKQELINSAADFLLPMTHQSLARDQELAQHMLKVSDDNSHHVIVGGHEHEPIDELVTSHDKNSSVRILKSGTNAEHASIIDLHFDVSSDNKTRVEKVDYDLVNVRSRSPAMIVQKIADSHNSLIQKLEQEVIINAEPLLPPGVTLSSERSRHQQTSVGAVFCQFIKDELEVDAALINGATIKGNMTYPDNQMSYAQLQQELPFPTKIVTVPMSRLELQSAIDYSRNHLEDGTVVVESEDVPRRGFLQVDLDLDLMHTGSYNDILQVALPRNILAGFCQIQPLMAVGDALKAKQQFPGPDDYMRAVDIIVRHSCKNRWYDMVHQHLKFDDLDLNKDGVLDRHEVKQLLQKVIGHEPADFVVDDMIASIDSDENGVIDIGEFSYLLATMEQEQQWKKRF